MHIVLFWKNLKGFSSRTSASWIPNSFENMFFFRPVLFWIESSRWPKTQLRSNCENHPHTYWKVESLRCTGFQHFKITKRLINGIICEGSSFRYKSWPRLKLKMILFNTKAIIFNFSENTNVENTQKSNWRLRKDKIAQVESPEWPNLPLNWMHPI